MKVGSKSIPDFRLNANLLSDVRILYEKFTDKEIDLVTVAEVLGHKSAKSGTFLMKISSMKCYGLIDGRGKVKVTDIGGKIAYENTQDEHTYNKCLVNAVKRIPLWSLIFNKFEKDGKTIKDEDFWIELRNNCALSIEEAKNRSPEILKLYREDIRLINMSLLIENNQVKNTNQEQQNDNTPNSVISKSTADVIGIGDDDYKVYLPKDQEQQQQVWKRLKRVVEAYVNPDEE